MPELSGRAPSRAPTRDPRGKDGAVEERAVGASASERQEAPNRIPIRTARGEERAVGASASERQRVTDKVGVVIPVRAFALGKARLAAELDDGQRTALARRLADTVAVAAQPMPVVVVTG